jgi:SAM-dependent methyltransferase
MVVADMGCGYMQRPFKDVLAQVCKHVYAVDVGAELLAQAPHDNMQFVVADFTQRIEAIPDGGLDVVFCISVLEELGGALGDALKEFYRCLRPGGLCVITCDVKFDKDKPLGQFGAVDLEQLELAIKLSGLEARDRFNYDIANALYHVTFNLCVFHAVLVKP